MWILLNYIYWYQIFTFSLRCTFALYKEIPETNILEECIWEQEKIYFTSVYLKNYEECCRQLARHKFSFFLILLWSLRDLNCYCEWLNLQKYDLFQNVNLIIITASYLLWPLDHLFWKNSKLNCHWPHKYVQFSSSWPHVFWIYREYLCEVWCWKYANFIIAKQGGREGIKSKIWSLYSNGFW